MTLGERIKTARKDRKMTRVQLGKDVGITEQVIYYFEHGLRVPSVQTLTEIAAVLDVSLDWLCGLEELKKERA